MQSRCCTPREDRLNACDKYYWILEHPAFINKGYVSPALDVDPHMVCPTTDRIEDFSRLNTKHRLWVELMVPYFDTDINEWRHSHDYHCDTGGDTWEEMIESLYSLVLDKYGSYTDDDVAKKNFEIHGIRIHSQTCKAKNRKLHVRWNLNQPKWSDDILKEHYIETIQEEVKEVQGTILALTEYRKTCNISEYVDVDAEMEKMQFILFEQQLSLQTGIDLVRK